MFVFSGYSLLGEWRRAAVGGMPTRKWLVGNLVEMTEKMGINDWKTSKAYLKTAVWPSNICGPRYRALWAEVEKKRKEFEDNSTG
ncbi:hypothetical protein IFR05_012772 [Cadophora sp. M221]|nr:hypothetical protein IFR05_012772 [Cadophora sp. M221]